MHNLEIEDFYHHDFTTASGWEVFVARLEEIMHGWKLCSPEAELPLKLVDSSNLDWVEASEKLHFADAGFELKHIQRKFNGNVENSSTPKEDVTFQSERCALNVTNNFTKLDGNYLELAHYYGLSEFLILIPSKNETAIDETRIKILFSSLAIAATNANCNIPAFVQILEPWQKMYTGIKVDRGTCTYFDMVHLKKIPSYCKYLTGLLSLFKQKIGTGCGMRLDPVTISVRFSYLLKDWTNSTWTQDPPDFDFMQGETLGVGELGHLPFGATFDPIGELHLFTTWRGMSENVVVDSEAFTDLEPELASEWSVQVKMVQSTSCLLSEYLTDFLHLCDSPKTMVDLLGVTATNISEDLQAFSSAFSALTDSSISSISTVVGKTTAKKNKDVEGPISEEVLSPILYFLFPDAEENSKTPYGEISIYNVDEDQWKGVKTCAMDSLVWRLAIVAAHCAHNLGGATALAQLWYEFVQEIRYRWEMGIHIPGVAPGFPDSVHTCILHQKLQMINCCTQKKKSRIQAAQVSQSTDPEDIETESEEDEFFECNNDSNQGSHEDNPKPRSHTKAKDLLWNKPTGRLAKHPFFKLIETGDSLYLPVTQDPVPKTEDQLEEDAQVMMQLGTDKYASEMRARLMSASLLSDMESFKAANPGSILEDFIRWYSPRDWIADGKVDEWGQPSGHLSDRMLIPNNPWTTTWASALPVPAFRQKRLFDDTREAEKALHYLGSKRIGEVAQLLLPALTHAALYTLSLQKQEALPNLSDVAQSILQKLQFATKPIEQKLQLYKEIAQDIEGVEALVAQVNSLQHKLNSDGNGSKEFTSFLIELMRGKEVTVPGGAKRNIGSRIVEMFRDAQKAAYLLTSVNSADEADAQADDSYKTFPEPSCKEFILHVMAPRPSSTSTPQMQRLYACLEQNSIRLAGSFAEDTVFL